MHVYFIYIYSKSLSCQLVVLIDMAHYLTELNLLNLLVLLIYRVYKADTINTPQVRERWVMWPASVSHKL